MLSFPCCYPRIRWCQTRCLIKLKLCRKMGNRLLHLTRTRMLLQSTVIKSENLLLMCMLEYFVGHTRIVDLKCLNTSIPSGGQLKFMFDRMCMIMIKFLELTWRPTPGGLGRRSIRMLGPIMFDNTESPI